MTYPKIANRVIEWGIIFLIVFTPIAFGTVHPWAYTIMELTVCFLVIIWIIRLGLININKTTTFPNLEPPIPGPDRRADRTRAGSNQQSAIPKRKLSRASITPNSELPDLISAKHISPGRTPNSDIRRSTILVNRFGFIKTPLTIPIIIFVGLVLFQLTPLPPGVLKFLSPNTYKLYKTTLPDWQEDSQSTINNLPKSEEAGQQSLTYDSKSQILNRKSQISNSSWQSISVYKHATKTELYKILSYIGMFFLIVNYNPSTRSRQPITREHRSQIKTIITRLIIAMVVVGCFESIYGLLECLSGHQHIFYRKKVADAFVTGTYVNRNHFAGYMAIIICMSFGYITYLFSDTSKSKTSGWRQRLSRIINLIGTRAGLLFFLILIMSSALILSGSRMGICSFIAAIILMSILMSKKVSMKKMLFILLPICLMAVWIGLNPVIARFSHISHSMETEGNRTQIWEDTCNLVKDFPVLGTGLGTYEYMFPKHKTIKRQLLYDHAHNDYLEIITDTGFMGFIIVMAGAAYYLFAVVKMWFRGTNSFVKGITAGCLGGIAYIILHSLTDFNLHIPANALHLSIITGIMHKTVTQL